MASPSLLPVNGDFGEFHNSGRNVSLDDRHIMDIKVRSFSSYNACLYKKRKILMDGDFSSCEISREIRSSLPVLSLLDYYMEPCLKDWAAREAADLGYSSRVPDFTVGRIGYEYVRFLGNTDARWLDLDRIVKFNSHELVVYEDES